MFRIVCFVEDNKLSKVLHAVKGLVLNMEVPQPVVNATVENGKIAQASDTSTVYELILLNLRKKFKDGDIISGVEIHTAIKEIGSSTDKGYIVRKLMETKALKPTSKRNVYKLA